MKIFFVFFFLSIFYYFYKNKKLKIAIVAIGKMENHYIKEWVTHYYHLGFKKIFLYDNNDIDGERFEDEISDFIKNNFIEIINYRGKYSDKYNLQSKAYVDCYINRVKDYDYLAIFDIDEFLYLNNYTHISDYLSQPKFKDFDCIRFPWLIMDDNDLIIVQNNNYSLNKRFLRGKFSQLGKSIFKTGFKQINSTIFLNSHGPIGLKSCDPDGKICNNGLNKKIRHSWIYEKPQKKKDYIKHFRYKTLQEFIDLKMVRLYPDQSHQKAKKDITFDNFFKVNKINKEKINYIKKRGFKYK